MAACEAPRPPRASGEEGVPQRAAAGPLQVRAIGVRAYMCTDIAFITEAGSPSYR